MNNINIKQIEKYKKVFGFSKMKKLWQEFLISSEDNWKKINDAKNEDYRQFFHNWKSNSQVFGMSDFSKICSQIEENILCHRYSKIPKLISLSKKCYNTSIKEVKIIFTTWEKNNE